MSREEKPVIAVVVMVAVAHTPVAAWRTRDFHHARDACIQHEIKAAKERLYSIQEEKSKTARDEISKAQAHHRQTLVQDKSRPTKEEPRSPECSRR